MQWQNEERINQFIEKFPALKICLDRDKKNTRINIKVERVDQALLFSHGDGVLRSNGGFMYYDGPTGKFACEYVSAINICRKDGNLADILVTKKRGPVLRILEMLDLNDVAYIIKVEKHAFYEYTEEGDHYGPYSSTEIRVTIYRLPKGKNGLQKLMEKASMCNAEVRLISRNLLQGTLNRDPLYAKANDQLSLLADRFAANVYASGLREVVDKSETGRMSGKFDEVTLLAYESADRMLFTLRDDNNYITFIADATSKWVNLGIQGIDATYKGAKHLVDTVTSIWRIHIHHDCLMDDSNLGSMLSEDPHVNYCGF